MSHPYGEREATLIMQKLNQGWVSASGVDGMLAFVKVRPPKTHMGIWSLDIQMSHDIVTITFEKSELKLLVEQLVKAL